MSMSYNSQELVDEMNDFQELVDEMNDSQELVDEMNDSQEIVDEIDDLQEPVDEWVVEIEGRLENPEICIHASMGSSIEKHPSIFGNWKHWDDFGASFIPETKKWQLVTCMTHWFGLNLKSYYEYMQGNVARAWSYYHVVDVQFHTTENRKRFIEHLLVSSCFLILAMVYITKEQEYREVIMHKIVNQSRFPEVVTYKYFQHLFTFFKGDKVKMQRYMITMNYQIPWFVLEAVYTEFSNTSKLSDILIHKLALTCLPTYPIEHPSKVDGNTIPEGGFKHILHIFHWSRTLNGKYLSNQSNKLIGHFHIPSVTELQLSQTVFVKNEGGPIDVCYSDDWRFSRMMQLTPFHVLEYSNILFESLLKFEGRYGFICGYPFTAYVACMVCFLKTEADVGVLREIGVIPTTTFDDKDVLCFVQEIKSSIRTNLPMPNELSFLEEKVMAHHKKSVYRVIGEFKERYCSNAWIILSVIAAILLFALTFIQTLYGTLSYYKQ